MRHAWVPGSSWKSGASVDGEVVGALVGAGLLLAELHEDVVEERRRAEPVQLRAQPLLAERLVDEHEVLHRLLRLADPAGRLEADMPTGLIVHVAHRLEHA